MSFRQLLRGLLNPASILGELAGILSLAAAFGAPVTEAQSHSILVFGGALSLVLFTHGLTKALTYLTPQTVMGLVTAAIGVAIAFGLQITAAQQTHILNLTGVLAGLLLVHGVVHTIARDRLIPKGTQTGHEVGTLGPEDEAFVRRVVAEILSKVTLAPAAVESSAPSTAAGEQA